jgi:sialic acid synthase SpsE
VKKFQDCEIKPLNKMAKSIVAASPIRKGQKINKSDLALKSPANGMKPYFLEQVIGRISPRDFEIDDYVIIDGLIEK